MNDHPYIKFSEIHKSFPGVKALDDVTFEINRGEIHAICGENGAGKSTLMNILAGNYHPDRGFIEIDGEKTRFKNHSQSLTRGISVVYQERSLVPTLNVAENIFIDRQPKNKLGFIDKKKMHERAAELCREIQLDVAPGANVGRLLSALKQMVEIAKALSVKCEVLILDEPTAAIAEKEIQILFEVIQKLKERGLSIIYISHHLQEIFQIADRVTVLKDGKYVGTREVSEVTIDKLIQMMVGRDLEVEQYTPSFENKTVLSVQNVSSRGFGNISFALKQNEILGFAGLAGSGRTELARAIIGASTIHAGEIKVKGKRVKIKNPEQAIACGIGYLPEDRKEQGLFLNMSVAQNIISANLKAVSRKGVILEKLISEFSQTLKQRLRIVCPSIRTEANQLSGGNQQKIVFAKWLMANPDILIIDEPTRGVDVGAKSEIYRILRQLSKKGTSIVVISSDLPEILAISDRVIVMHNGEIEGELGREEATEEKIMHYASGVNRK